MENFTRSQPFQRPPPFFGSRAFFPRKWWNPNRSERAIEPPPRRIRNCAEASVDSLSTPTVVEICSTRVKKSWRYSYPLPAGRWVRGEVAFSKVVNSDGIKRERRKGEGGELKERGRKAKAYPAVLHATANSRSDCNVRRFVDFDGTRIRRCEASLCRDRRGPLCYVYVYIILNTYHNIL